MNVAKINQEWHQILRKAKCKEMKENVEHLRNWIERVLNLKNRTIANLMVELDEAEQQYAHNFQTHIAQIQKIIESHHEDVNALHEQYQQDSKEILETSMLEQQDITEKAQGNQTYLKTIIFGLDQETDDDMKKRKEKFIDDYNEVVSSVSVY